MWFPTGRRRLSARSAYRQDSPKSPISAILIALLPPPIIGSVRTVACGAVSQGRRQSDMRWLTDNICAPWYDEAELPLLASKIVGGTRPANGMKR